MADTAKHSSLNCTSKSLFTSGPNLMIMLVESGSPLFWVTKTTQRVKIVTRLASACTEMKIYDLLNVGNEWPRVVKSNTGGQRRLAVHNKILYDPSPCEAVSKKNMGQSKGATNVPVEPESARPGLEPAQLQSAVSAGNQ